MPSDEIGDILSRYDSALQQRDEEKRRAEVERAEFEEAAGLVLQQVIKPKLEALRNQLTALGHTAQVSDSPLDLPGGSGQKGPAVAIHITPKRGGHQYATVISFVAYHKEMMGRAGLADNIHYQYMSREQGYKPLSEMTDQVVDEVIKKAVAEIFDPSRIPW